MYMCRVCLSSSVDKDIKELKTSKKEGSKSYTEILSFCLDIHVSDETKTCTKLCNKCFRKILAYHKFKTLALKSDTYLKTLNVDFSIKREHILFDNENENDNQCEPLFRNNNIMVSFNYNDHYEDVLCNDIVHVDGDGIAGNDIKNEPALKVEIKEDANDYQSDGELLSVLKKIKEEDPSAISLIPLKENTKELKVGKRGKCKKKKSIEKPNKQICEECGISVCDLKEHSMQHVPKQDRKRIQCKQCDKTFTTYGARYKHNKVRHLGIKHRCEICGKEVSHLNAHMSRFHLPEKLKAHCLFCDKSFMYQSLLDQHMLHHTKDKPYECDICQKRFRLKNTMMLHKRQVHENEKSHLCQFCSKTFFKKYHLQVHLRSHTKEKPYKCEECGKYFSCASTLRNHKETHSTDRNFQCDHCDAKFVKRGYLRAHMVCHTKEKRYPCKYCGVKFGRSDHRKRHEFTAHEKNVLPS